MIRLALLATTAALGAAAASLPAAAQDMRPFLPADGAVLDVAAEGSTTRVPDLALIQAGVVTQAGSAAEAMQQNSARMASVIAALRKAGVAERDLQTAAVSLNPVYRNEDNQPPVITGYQASNQLTVRFREIAKSGAILDTLVRQGANNISGPNLTLDKPEAAMDEARADAIAKARARAELYARAAGLRVDRILAISEGGSIGPQEIIVSGTRRGAFAAADTQVLPGEREVSINVSVRFLLK
ncbi:SIMPL domain-containing protein [Sphingomonas sp. S2-65]|uniref:SIMPL domain-containing protein n=1 Tax=Sphingomonas sp. S2-65 TaxID=2903960 RepID=UPI001F47BB5C|nr:SIMPL domain-containing protein [Sphingomonas sp. S2-65]UYY56927.1 SIMPL domain-containing protein [Sphingomonas sp. S2-65]